MYVQILNNAVYEDSMHCDWDIFLSLFMVSLFFIFITNILYYIYNVKTLQYRENPQNKKKLL